MAVVVVAGTGGCSLGDRQAMANRVINATRRAEVAGTAKATVSVDTKVIKGRVNIVPGPPRIVAAAAPDLNAVLDFRSGRSAVGVKGDDLSTATLLFDGTRVFERRGIKADPVSSPAGVGGATAPAALASAAAGGAAAPAAGAATNLIPLVTAAKAPAAASQPAVTTTTTQPPSSSPANGGDRLHRVGGTARKWIAFDYASLPKSSDTKTAGSFAISPLVIEQLGLGTLTGSIHNVGTESIGATVTTHYRMNVSREKAERRLPESARKQLNKLFKANGIGKDVYPAEAWIDGAGVLRRFSVRFRQTLSSTDRDDLHVTIDLHDTGAPVNIPVPESKEIAVVRDLGQFIHAAVES